MTDEQCEKICSAIRALTLSLAISVGVGTLIVALNINAVGSKIESAGRR